MGITNSSSCKVGPSAIGMDVMTNDGTMRSFTDCIQWPTFFALVVNHTELGEFNLLSWMHTICEPKGYHYILIVNSSAKVSCQLQSAWVWWERFDLQIAWDRTSLQMLCKVGRIQSANQMCITTSSIQLHLQSCATAIIGMGVMRRIWFNWTMRFAGCMHPTFFELIAQSWEKWMQSANQMGKFH